jgi:DtxR family transcriptional regulator, Mn-dependent transcriptional regulator
MEIAENPARGKARRSRIQKARQGCIITLGLSAPHPATIADKTEAPISRPSKKTSSPSAGDTAHIKPADQPSRAVQDYLKALHSLGGAERLVSPAELAAKLEVRAASVTGMLKRLSEGGWIDYRTGRGAQLTRSGTAEARRVIRRHRLMELFLTRVLGLDWSEVDSEAEALEHTISPRLEQAIANYLGEPLEDPHGHPIPTREGELAHRELRPLHTFEPDQEVVIREVQDDRPDRLRRWSDLGLVPGVTITLLRRHVLDGTFEVKVGDQIVTLAAEGLIGVLAEPSRPVGTRRPGRARERPPTRARSR